MMQDAKISAVHRQRLAVVYVRQSSPTQLERNRESTLRQYNFVARATALGWIRYVFGNLDPTDAYDETDRAVSDAMQSAWTEFARSGVPSSGFSWPRFDPSTP